MISNFAAKYCLKQNNDMEQIHQDVDTLVVVGSWNKYIFSEEWVIANILGEGVRYTIQYPLNALGSLKFSLENVTFYIFGDRLLFQLNNDLDLSYREIIRTARKIFQKLIHTPVTALGVNFIYQTSDNLGMLNQLPKNEDLVKAIGHDISSSELSRTFKLSENETLNFKVEQKDENANIFNFNFDFGIKSLSEALNIIGDDDDLILRKRNFANDIINAI